MTLATLDEAVDAARDELVRRGAPAPDALFLLATGVRALPDGYRSSWRQPLRPVRGVPDAWRDATLLAAEFDGALAWFVEDAPGDDPRGDAPAPGAPAPPPWTRGFPCWLAADCGASLLVHAAGGSALPAPEGALQPGALALVSDHLNLSGATPLFGLGPSRLGPLFPDTTQLHHAGLRLAAQRRAREAGLECAEAVAACTAGPALETRAEREYYARAGAHVAVQGLADPLLAAAHAGLSCLSVVAVIGGEGASTIRTWLEHAQALAPELERLLELLAPEVARVARARREEPR